jgi:hypothetical protein|tara:strand:+ start:5012 stop:7780 length:2769 start_codon:yes stop_codon:yes gene_type:complete
MSVQLILYPQNTSGQYNELSTDPNEFVVNGLNFVGLGSSASFDSSLGIGTTQGLPVLQDALNNQPPNIINTWYRFRSTLGGTPALPTVTSGDAVFNSIASNNTSGIYQRLSNLSVGASYTVRLNLSTTSSGSLYISIANGTSVSFGQPFLALSSSITFNFTATATDNILTIRYTNSVATNIAISSISCLPTAISPSDSISILENGQVLCDLYEDEDIPLTLSIDDFKNVAEQIQSYSKAFSLPATKRNNQIFNNIFEITRNDDGIIFNPYVRTKCVLKQNGILIFEGYLRLIDIQDKLGETSYNVNLNSEVIALADYLEGRTFSDLNLTELEHNYTKANIKSSWTSGVTYTQSGTSGFRTSDTVKYPFVNWDNQILISNGSTGNNATIGNPELTSLQQAYRPFVKIKYLIERIFQDTPFSFTSEFFDEADFKKLYMDFNWGDALAPNTNMGEGEGENDDTTGVTAGTSFTRLRFDVETFSDASELGYDNSTSKFTANRDNQYYYVYSDFVIGYSGAGSGPASQKVGVMGWEKFDSGGTTTNYIAGYKDLYSAGISAGLIQYSKNFIVVLNAGESIRPVFKKIGSVTLDQETTQGLAAFTPNSTTVITGTSVITSEVLMQNLRGELGQWQFLKGIMTMFNLVSIPDKSDPNNMLIEPYADVFIKTTKGTSLADRSISHDWTDKVDVSEIKLTPLTDLNKKTIFKFVEDDDDYAFSMYKDAVSGHLYGSKVFDASGFTILEGNKEIIAEPFAATVPRPLDSQFPNFIVPMIYSYNPDDGTSSGFDNSPRIMYDNGVKDSGTTYYIPAQNGGSSENQSDFLQFSHLSTISTAQGTLDFHFGECQLIQPIGNAVNDNLFNLYWLPYFSELYNPNTRIMTLKVNLTAGDISTFNLYDTVFIKNRKFRVNKIDYKPNDLATVEFILIP